jgi:hypothetical protein
MKGYEREKKITQLEKGRMGNAKERISESD